MPYRSLALSLLCFFPLLPGVAIGQQPAQAPLDYFHRVTAREVRLTSDGWHPLAEAVVSPLISSPVLWVQIDRLVVPDSQVSIEIIGYVGDQFVDREILYDMKQGERRSFRMKNEGYRSSAWDETIYYKINASPSFQVSKQLGDNSVVEATVEYDPIIFSWRFILYFIVVGSITWYIWRILSWDRLCTFSERSWNGRWVSAVSLSAQLLLIFLILDEFGLFLSEWGVDPWILATFRELTGLPGVSELIYLANLVLIIPATYSIVAATNQSFLTERVAAEAPGTTEWIDPFVRRMSLLAAIFVLLLSLMIGLLQALIWNLYGPTVGLTAPQMWGALVLVFVPLFPLARMGRLWKHLGAMNPYYRTHWYRSVSNSSMLLVVFLTFAQTMITKVVLLLPVINATRERILKRLVGMVPRSRWDIGSLATVRDGDRWHRILFLVLTTSAFPLIMNWQFANGPLPPAGSVYPKTVTVSFLLTIYMFFYFVATGSKRGRGFISILWLLLTVTTVHFSILLVPGWFLPSTGADGINLYSFFSELFGSTAPASVFSVLLHLMTVGMFLMLERIFRLSGRLQADRFNNARDFREYAALMHMRFLGATLFLMSFVIVIAGTVPVAVRSAVIGTSVFEMMAALTAVYAVSMELLFPSMRSLHEEVVATGGSALVADLRSRHRWLRLFGIWNNGVVTPLAVGARVALFVGIFGLTFGLAHASRSMVTSDMQIAWFHPFDTQAQIQDIVVQGTTVVCDAGSWVYAIDAKTGQRLWTMSGTLWPFTRPATDTSLWIFDRKRVRLVRTDDGYILWDRKILKTANDPYTYAHPLGTAFGFGVMKSGDNIHLVDPSVAREIRTIVDVRRPFAQLNGGPLVWVERRGDVLALRSPAGNVVRLFSPSDTIRRMSSYRDGVLVSYDSTIAFHSLDGTLRWSRKERINPADDFIVDLRFGHVIVVSSRPEPMRAFDAETGNLMWSRDSLSPGLQSMIENRRWRPEGWQLADSTLVCRYESEDENDRRVIDLRTGQDLFAMRGALTVVGPASIVGIGSYYIDIRNHRGQVRHRDPYIISMAERHDYDLGAQTTRTAPSAVQIDGETIYWANGYGLYRGAFE